MTSLDVLVCWLLAVSIALIWAAYKSGQED